MSRKKYESFNFFNLIYESYFLIRSFATATNYAASKRELEGTGVYANISERSSNDSDFYIGYGITGKYLYQLSENFGLLTNISYIINRPTFTTKEGATSLNYRDLNSEYALDGLEFSIGVRYDW